MCKYEYKGLYGSDTRSFCVLVISEQDVSQGTLRLNLKINKKFFELNAEINFFLVNILIAFLII